ncbi:MAG: hypothetical protein F6K11_35765 [Leptolyngbya sp. SIO3F4]|nr:hypothetical protein [Leptolyngbya sp. SIO3F4]
MGRRDPEWMFKRLSVRRPYTCCDLEGQFVFTPFCNHLAGGEWRLLAWLEREKISYDIISGADLHFGKGDLNNYSAIIFSTHSEYWTRKMYEKVKFAHQNHGLWLVNLSGNTMYREIEYFDDGSTRCVSLEFGESCADETQLLGVRFTEDDYATCAPYKVLEPEHWVFDNLSTERKRLCFGGLSLNQNIFQIDSFYNAGHPGLEGGLVGMGASGWETDKLSVSAPKDIRIIAKGLNRKGGAHMVVREPNGSRGGMFSASSLTFSGCLLIDNIASRVVKNVLGKALLNK